MNQSANIPSVQNENWKYSPVKLIPENFAGLKNEKKMVVLASEQRVLVTKYVDGEEFNHTSLEITLGENASLTHWHLFGENIGVAHIDEITINIDKNASYVLNALTLGSRWSRCDVHVKLLGQGAHCSLNGLDLGRGEASVDRHVHIEHLVPQTTSSQLFKGIFDDRSSLSFFGKIKVAKGADNSNAKQINRNLLLSAEAVVNTRPQLEIDTDEVSCTHGATVGQLDQDAIFYLRARGLSEVAAKSLLVEAFAKEVLEVFAATPERVEFENQVQAWLGSKGQ